MLWWHTHVGQQWLTTDSHKEIDIIQVYLYGAHHAVRQPELSITRQSISEALYLGLLFLNVRDCAKTQKRCSSVSRLLFSDLPFWFPHTETFLSWASLTIHCSVSALLHGKHFFLGSVVILILIAPLALCLASGRSDTQGLLIFLS